MISIYSSVIFLKVDQQTRVNVITMRPSSQYYITLHPRHKTQPTTIVKKTYKLIKCIRIISQYARRAFVYLRLLSDAQIKHRRKKKIRKIVKHSSYMLDKTFVCQTSELNIKTEYRDIIMYVSFKLLLFLLLSD